MFTTEKSRISSKGTWKDAEFLLKWTLTPEDTMVVRRFRGSPGRLHAALQLLTLRQFGRTCSDISKVPEMVISFLCDSLEMDPFDPAGLQIHASTSSIDGGSLMFT